jgi:hypothetical protein
LRTLECDVVACPDLHENLLEYVPLGKPNGVTMVPKSIEQMLGFRAAISQGARITL